MAGTVCCYCLAVLVTISSNILMQGLDTQNMLHPCYSSYPNHRDPLFCSSSKILHHTKTVDHNGGQWLLDCMSPTWSYPSTWFHSHYNTTGGDALRAVVFLLSSGIGQQVGQRESQRTRSIYSHLTLVFAASNNLLCENINKYKNFFRYS